MKTALLALAALTLTGCAEAVRQRDERFAHVRNTVPTCNSDRECELKWSAARLWVLSNAGMKLQHVTPDFLETYNPPQHSTNLAARVVKKPMVGGGYQIGVALWCNNIFGCFPDPAVAAQNFNDVVNAAAPGSSTVLVPPSPPGPPPGPPSSAVATPGASSDFYCPPGTRRAGDGCLSDSAFPSIPTPSTPVGSPEPAWATGL